MKNTHLTFPNLRTYEAPGEKGMEVGVKGWEKPWRAVRRRPFSNNQQILSEMRVTRQAIILKKLSRPLATLSTYGQTTKMLLQMHLRLITTSTKLLHNSSRIGDLQKKATG